MSQLSEVAKELRELLLQTHSTSPGSKVSWFDLGRAAGLRDAIRIVEGRESDMEVQSSQSEDARDHTVDVIAGKLSRHIGSMAVSEQGPGYRAGLVDALAIVEGRPDF